MATGFLLALQNSLITVHVCVCTYQLHYVHCDLTVYDKYEDCKRFPGKNKLARLAISG